MNLPPRRPVLGRALLAVTVLGMMAGVSSAELGPAPNTLNLKPRFGDPLPRSPVPLIPPASDLARLDAAEEKRARRAAKRLKERR